MTSILCNIEEEESDETGKYEDMEPWWMPRFRGEKHFVKIRILHTHLFSLLASLMVSDVDAVDDESMEIRESS
jgi:hypothetical protein